MSLRKTITLLCSLIMLTAILLSDMTIFLFYRRSVRNEALQAACIETSRIEEAFANYQSQLSALPGSDYLPSVQEAEYFFKTNREDLTILAINGREIFNRTDLSAAEITAGNAVTFDRYQYYETALSGTPYVAFRTTVSGSVSMLHLYDMSVPRRKLLRLAAVMVSISAIVILLAILLLRRLLMRAFQPMEALSAQARAIADGAYDRRAEIVRRDEVGQLAADFNQMAEAVQTHIRAVEDSEQRKTMFMGSLTHELKTPLTAMSGYAQTLRAVLLSPEDTETALRYIDSESRRLDRLAKQMMRLLELDQETPLQMEDIPAEALIADAITTCTPHANSKQITLRKCGAEGILRCDRDLMTDVIINLIDNAIRASREGDSIEISAKDGVLTVADHGCGIPEAEITRITEPFYMVDKSRSRKSGGAGLGLAIVSAILRQHGITLEIESKVGSGTRMNLHFVDIALNT